MWTFCSPGAKSAPPKEAVVPGLLGCITAVPTSFRNCGLVIVRNRVVRDEIEASAGTSFGNGKSIDVDVVVVSIPAVETTRGSRKKG